MEARFQSTAFLFGNSVHNEDELRTPPEEGFSTVPKVLVEEGLDAEVLNCGLAGESIGREADMAVESLMDLEATNFDSLSQTHRKYDVEVEGVADGRKGELRTQQRSDSTKYQPGAHQRPIALN